MDRRVTSNQQVAVGRLEEQARQGEIRLAMEVEFINRRLLELDVRLQQRYDGQTASIAAAFSAAKEANAAAFAAAKEAVSKAEQSTEKRFDDTNEFRGQLNDLLATLMPRNEGNTRFDALRSESVARFDNLSEKIDRMRERLDKSEGAGKGLNQSWVYLLGGVTLIATICAMVVTLSRLGN